MFMSGSFKKYTDLKNQAPVDKMDSVGRLANDASQLDHFVHEVEIMKEDVKTMGKLRKRLNEMNENSKSIQNAAKMKELRGHMDSDVDHILRLAKSIKKRIGGLDEKSSSNASNAKIHGAGSSIDRTKISVIMGIGKKLREMMDEFQGLRAQTAAAYKETVEFNYFKFTGEKQYLETIESLASNGETGEWFRDAVEEHGRDGVVDFVEEVKERREGSKNMQRNLVELHQTFVDMAALVEAHAHKMANGGGEKPVARRNSIMKSSGVAQLLDEPEHYDMEAKRRATIALIVAITVFLMIIVPLFVVESQRDME